MAYKFQTGAAIMSGSLSQQGAFEVQSDINETTLFDIERTAGNVSGSGKIDFVGAMKSIGAIASSGSITAGSSFIIGSADLNEVDMEKLDGITNGTGAANKCLVLDGSRDVDTINALGIASMANNWTNAGLTVADLGTVTAATSITSTDLIGTNIDGIIGADTARAGTFTSVVGTTGVYSGILKTDDTTEATSATDGSLQTDGGLSVAKAIFNSTAATLAAASGVVTMGSTTALTVSAAGLLNVNNATDATSKTDGSLQTDGGLSVAKAIYNGTAATFAADSGVVTMGAATALTVSAAGLLNVNNATEATSTTDGSLQTDGGLSVAKSAVIGDDLDLLSDGAVLNIGSTSKFTLTDQSANQCVMAASGARLAFGNAGEYISGDGTDLDIISSGDLDITATLVDITGALTVSGLTTASGRVVVDDGTDATSGTDGSLQTDGGLSVVKKAYFAGAATLNSTGNTIEAADTVMAVADDFLYFRDADGVMKRDQWADIATAIAGTGITATAGVLSVAAASGVDAHGDADATLTEAFNYASAAMTADRTWSLPASAGMAVGDVVYVKAGALSGNMIKVTPVGSQTIDGVAAAANLESNGAAISLKYVAANSWMIF